MMSAFTILILTLLAVSIRAVPLSPRDVYNPPITNPNAQTVWHPGETHLVTWDTSGLPQGLPNVGRVVLGFLFNNSENLMLANPLATNFKLTEGQAQIVVPSVPPRHDYIVVVFGDSGNASPMFTIEDSSEPTTPTALTTSAIPSTLNTPAAAASPTNTVITSTNTVTMAASHDATSSITFTSASAIPLQASTSVPAGLPSSQSSAGTATRIYDMRMSAIGVMLFMLCYNIF